jgi:hypothetical protein
MAGDGVSEPTPVQVAESEPTPALVGATTAVLEHEMKPEKHQPLYRKRFFFMYLILGLALIATVAGVVLALNDSITAGAPPWSAWKPAGSSSAKTNTIAQKIGGQYRLPSGHQMLDIYAKKLTVPVTTSSGASEVPIAAVAIRGPKGKVDTISMVSDSDSRLFQLCGTGTACAIGEGKASIARGQLVRREALELALYTFKYVPGTNHVIAFMPPPPGSQPSTLIYLNKSDLQPMLSKPLADTIAAKTPLPTTITAAAGNAVDKIMMPHLYKFSLQQTELGQAVLVLQPATA